MGYDSPQWYMVAADLESAAFHSTGHGEGNAVVIEFRVPTEPKKFEDGGTRNMWPGYPYLWKPNPINWEGHASKWYALKQPIPPEFIRRVIKVKSKEASKYRDAIRLAMKSSVRVAWTGKTQWRVFEYVPVNPHGHYRVECSSCGKVIRQCRCMGPKTIIYETCDQCKSLGLGA
jgi:hypothetical protein